MMTFQLFLLIALSFKVTIKPLDAMLSSFCRLDIIEKDHHNVDRCLQECLKFWLSQADGAKSPTWFSLIVAMRHIGEITTANGIDREKHPACEILDRYTSDPTVQRNLLRLSYFLQSENIISKKIWSSGEKLLKDVKKTICQNDQHLKTFADILQRSDRTEKVGKAILNEYKEYKEECTNEDYKITAEKGIHLDIVNFTKVRMEYAATFDAIDKVIASDTPSLAELRTFLRRGHGYCKLTSQCERATREGNPIILTELMPSSLRKELETGLPLPYPAILSISLDVACALNYLHLFKPHPIIHRDISSGNVLLQPTSHMGIGWRAKVSDYGSANLQNLIATTENPGNRVYSAPEAGNPREHSPAMDVFSYGVLLIEMSISAIPQPGNRRQDINSIRRAGFKGLVQRCVMDNYELRPKMSDIINELTQNTFDEFKGKQDQESIGVKEATKYGKVLYSGPGQNPPSDMKKKLNLRFDMNT
uniref:Protein kinase domain-containing protein n=1 Tax=Amphimedon queenslandica TaxID=400682 RepID=A0A1X7UXF9_AMPQE